jgi:hypothetical protein
MRHADDRRHRSVDEQDHHAALMKEIRRHASDDSIRWRR